MKHKTTQQLYAYWNDIRGERIFPRRFEIEPSRIAPLLPDTFIIERVDFATYRFRLAGTRLCELFGTEFRGSDFLDGWMAEDRETLEHALHLSAQQGGVVHLEVAAANAEGGRQVTFEIVLLPLVHMQPSADRFIGAWCTLDPPSWLGGERLASPRIVASDVVWPDGRPHFVVESQERQVPFLPHVRKSRLVKVDRRQFRVYDGGLTGAEKHES